MVTGGGGNPKGLVFPGLDGPPVFGAFISRSGAPSPRDIVLTSFDLDFFRSISFS